MPLCTRMQIIHSSNRIQSPLVVGMRRKEGDGGRTNCMAFVVHWSDTLRDAFQELTCNPFFCCKISQPHDTITGVTCGERTKPNKGTCPTNEPKLILDDTCINNLFVVCGGATYILSFFPPDAFRQAQLWRRRICIPAFCSAVFPWHPTGKQATSSFSP